MWSATRGRPPSGHGFADAAVEARLEPADSAAAHRHGPGVRQLDRAPVARARDADHPVEIDDVTAVHAGEAPGIEAGFDLAYGERAEELIPTVKNVGVVRVGVNRHDVLNGHVLGDPVALDRQVARNAARRRAGAAERGKAARADVGAVARFG